jgi:peptidoglycan-associated lipoprotein
MQRLPGLIALALCSLIAAGACARRSTPSSPTAPAPLVQDAPPLPPSEAVTQPAPPATASPLTEDEIFARKTLDELNAERPLSDAFFDFDDTTIRAEARAVLERNGDWLRRWPSTRVTIEGHADARGTNQYNLALGDRRAAAASDFLKALGIGPERLVAISRGEESPACGEETEACWQRNRRVHFLITAK